MDTTFIRQAKQATDRRLYIAFELAQRHWRLAFCDAVGRPRVVTLEAGKQSGGEKTPAKGPAPLWPHEGGAGGGFFEAGRGGFWVDRLFVGCGGEELLVGS